MLEVRDLWKMYEGNPLLSGVSFTVEPGETACLLGPSGGGKSTILRIIAGLEEAEKGDILWDGASLAGMPAHRRRFGLMFQDYALFPHKSVAQNVAFGLRMLNIPSAEIAGQVKDALSMVNMGEFADRRVTELSGGEQQRVALARALAPRPRLLMLDEPLGALDRRLREDLAEEIRSVLRTTGVPAIYVTHDQEEAFTVASQLLILYEGRIVQEGAPEEVYHRPVSSWVAGFFGLGNILPGQVVSSQPLQVQTTIGRFTSDDSCRPWTVGQRVNLLMRPDGAVLVNGKIEPVGIGGEPGENEVSGVVLDAVFQGLGFRADIKVEGKEPGEAPIHLRFVLPGIVKPGDEVALSIPASSIQCLE